MSSTTESESMKTRRWAGNAGPTTASAPSTNAVSVAIAMPQPRAASPLGLNARYTSAGTTRPAIAPRAGIVKRVRSVSSPIESCRRSSRPMTKKNNTIRPSLTQWRRSWS